MNETLLIIGVLVLVLTFMAGIAIIVIVFIKSAQRRVPSEEEIRQKYEQAWEEAKTIRLEDHSEDDNPVQ